MKPLVRFQQPLQSSDSGFTIIESLVALVVVAILLAATAPAIILSTATRVQARRVEQATQAAKAFLDGIQSGTIKDDKIPITKVDPTKSLTRKVSDSNYAKDYLLSNIPVPATKDNLYCFKKDGSISPPNNCISDFFYIQAFRIATQDTNLDDIQNYRLGIRVYRSDALFGSLIKTSDTIPNSNNTEQIQTSFRGTLGDRRRPLIEMTTEIVKGKSSYQDLCDRLGGCQ
jgi:prepilin-type N-terminal cleavage/methylation domain-containing protein